MRVLMLGWEFPPAIVGGLGMACFGLCRGLTALGVEVTVLLPGRPPSNEVEGIRLVGAGGAEGERGPEVESPSLSTYTTGASTTPDIIREVHRYARAVEGVVGDLGQFDLIHAHDWMTFPAGSRLRTITGRPLVCHIHSTEYDRSGEGGNPEIAAIEREGLRTADRVVAVSARTKREIVDRYGVEPGKVEVVHNAVDRSTLPPAPPVVLKPWERLVVFLGRLASQKGPEYFVEAAHRVLQRMGGVKFVLVGDGPLRPRLVRRVARLRRGRDILFAGFLDRADVGRILRMADCYVMTSVNEPFGISALEAMAFGLPTIIPREAGVGEVVGNVLRVDFWDVERLADRIVAVLEHASLRRTLGRRARREVEHLSWRRPAGRCLRLYRTLLSKEDAA